MNALRAAWSIALLLALAACANSAPPQTAVVPAESLACKVDADCTTKPHCKGETCRCVRDTCIAGKDAIDPVIDPAPVPPPET